MTSTIERIVTVHPGADVTLRMEILDAIDKVLRDHGAQRVWIDPASRADLVVLAEVETP